MVCISLYFRSGNYVAALITFRVIFSKSQAGAASDHLKFGQFSYIMYLIYPKSTLQSEKIGSQLFTLSGPT